MEVSPGIPELLSRTRVEVAPETYFLISLSHADWARVLKNPDLSPRGDAPYMVLRDHHEVTLLIDETDWRKLRPAAGVARVEGGFRVMTLDVELEWNVVGYLAHVTSILAGAGVSVGAVSAFSRDHLLVKQDDLGKALKALSTHVAELC